jgi:DNA-directed RNA polymerase specialized sigma24 family protein
MGRRLSISVLLSRSWNPFFGEGSSGHSWLCAIADHVRHDQSRWEEDQAEEEEAEKAVPFAPSNPGRPERDRDPEDEKRAKPARRELSTACLSASDMLGS